MPEHEPDLWIGVRVEYLLDFEGETCATEVKQFRPSSWPIRDANVKGSRLIGTSEQLQKALRESFSRFEHRLERASAKELSNMLPDDFDPALLAEITDTMELASTSEPTSSALTTRAAVRAEQFCL